MAASGYTPILIYASGTTTNVPSAANMTSSSTGAELAINYTDGKLFYKDNNGTVQTMATSGIGNNVTWSFGNLTMVVGGTGAIQLPSSTTTNRPGTATLTTANLSITGTAGQFAVSPALSSSLSLNQAVVITGTLTGTGSISGYTTGTTYYVVASTTSTFTLSTSINGTGVTTTAGTVTGLTFTLGAPAAGMLRFNTTTNQFEGYNGSAWSGVGGATISNDTSTATSLYPLFANATSGTALTVYTSSPQYTFVPSTGTLKAPFFVGTAPTTQTVSTGAFSYGTLGYSDVGLVQSLTASQNGYIQSVLQNSSSGFLASADLILSNNLGTASTYFADFGINSSNFGQFSGTGGTGGVSSTTLTITAVSSGGLSAGSVLTSPAATISYQLTSTAAATASSTLNSGGTSGTNTFGVTSVTGITVGQLITGTGITAPAFVGSIVGTTITVVTYAGAASNFSTTGSGTYNFYNPGGVGTYLMATAQTISNGTSLTAAVLGSFSLPNAAYLYANTCDLVVGTVTSNAIHFVVNNGATDALTIATTGAVTATVSSSAPVMSATNGIYINSKTVATSYTVPSGSSAHSVGPITVASGQSVTLPSGSRWVIL
jgi:hypothetical protein